MATPETKPATHRSLLNTICVIVMAIIVAAKALWLCMGISSVGLTTPMLLFAATFLSLAAATWFLAKGNRNLGIGLAWLGIILAFVAGQLGGVPAGPDHSRFEEQYRYHAFDYVFVLAAHLQFLLLRKTDRAAAPTANAA